MITPDEVIPLLLSACPSFATDWETAQTENLDPSEPGGASTTSTLAILSATSLLSRWRTRLRSSLPFST